MKGLLVQCAAFLYSWRVTNFAIHTYQSYRS